MSKLAFILTLCSTKDTTLIGSTGSDAKAQRNQGFGVWVLLLLPSFPGLVNLKRRTVKNSSEEPSADFSVWIQLDEGQKCYQRLLQAVF